jgi:hypothetical protein
MCSRPAWSAASGQRPEQRPDQCLLLDAAGVKRIRDAVTRDSARTAILRKNTEAALKAGPWTVTSQRPGHLKVDPHEYYSEGPYWWPDPKNPDGPYIRKDGQRNPARFMPNRRDIGDMSEAVLALGMGAAFAGDTRCADRAAKVLSVWFLDAATRMNPDLEYGQAVRGINNGRGTGIIDTASLIQAAQGVCLLEAAGNFDAQVAAGVRRWYADYATWMTTSKKGLDEKAAKNNHGTWWTTQVATYATFTGNTVWKKMCWDRFRDNLLPGEVQPNGSCPLEEARTRSLSYSTMNLDSFALLCRLGGFDGQDLWHFQSPKGITIGKAFRYLTPYVLHPDTWKKRQITAYEQDRALFPGLAAVGLQDGDLMSGYKTLSRATSPWIQFIDLAVRTG